MILRIWVSWIFYLFSKKSKTEFLDPYWGTEHRVSYEKGKKNSKISNVFLFLRTPYVRHLGRDLKNQILTFLKINSEFLILKFSGSTFVLVNKPKKVTLPVIQNIFFLLFVSVKCWLTLFHAIYSNDLARFWRHFFL